MRRKDKDDIRERVVAIIMDRLNVSAEEVDSSARFFNDFGADSLDQVDLVMAFEDEFGIKIGDEEAATLQTVDNVVEFLERSLNDRSFG